ncbi:Alpha/beta hydrolase family-protein [Aromatoleum petrolei]|nr:Alpha/beta hydrolase family-protein [Aromatoleum petrolei]
MCHAPREAGRASPTAPAAGEAGTASFLPNRIERRVLESDASLPYVVFEPSRGGAGAPILVTVHGISRNAWEQVSMFAPYAERAGVVLVAPLYEHARFPRYQRLSANERGERPAAVMEAIIAEVTLTTGAKGDRLYLFGFSGGGQFVHRYAMAHPDRVAGYVVGSAGWYTFPDAQRRYPYGVRYSRRLQMGGFDLGRFLTVPGWVLVGERDVHEGTAMRKTERVMVEQGLSRMERGLRWVDAVNARAAELGLAAPVRFEPLPRSPHSFRRSMRRGELGQRVFGHLFGLEESVVRGSEWGTTTSCAPERRAAE